MVIEVAAWWEIIIAIMLLIDVFSMNLLKLLSWELLLGACLGSALICSNLPIFFSLDLNTNLNCSVEKPH